MANDLCEKLTDEELFALEQYFSLLKSDVIDGDKHNDDVIAAFFLGKSWPRE